MPLPHPHMLHFSPRLLVYLGPRKPERMLNILIAKARLEARQHLTQEALAV